MKIWKMIGCLGLLVLVISCCVILAQPTEVSAKENEQDTVQEQSPVQDTQEQEASPDNTQQSATVEKTYSTGLAFRSNGDGTCALVGLGSCKDSYLLIPPKSPAGDTVTQILKGALASETLSAVEIPAGVTSLDADSFAMCTHLSRIHLATGNKSFLLQDGALYTADGQTLLYCPVARGARELSLHKSLKRVAAGAFAECPELTTVYFSGTAADWRNILIGDDNDALYEAAFKFNS